jgi:hypothetical protein
MLFVSILASYLFGVHIYHVLLTLYLFGCILIYHLEYIYILILRYSKS